MKEREIMDYLKSLEMLDLSEEEFEEKEISGKFNRIDLWKSRGKKIVIDSEFTNVLDLSYSALDEVILRGKFNLVDASMSKTKKINRKDAEIVELDKYQAKIGEIIK